MTKTTTETKKTPEVQETSIPMGERFETVGVFAKDFAGAAQTGTKAYFSAVAEIGSLVYGFGKQFVTETTEHATKTLKAKNINEMAEMQTEFVKHRAETAGEHIQELVELARDKAEEAVNPFNEMWKPKAA
ncbi:phasin family protein [Tropicibacter sp. R16_0]|uniref:TIGR01841 family phasin n=1 Tax=Tropicibacter sp. R16_0 TaxID=2821102 RepID=UPI001AD971DC|nr:phasin family protein [Tropicibacter sp. R16_0]